MLSLAPYRLTVQLNTGIAKSSVTSSVKPLLIICSIQNLFLHLTPSMYQEDESIKTADEDFNSQQYALYVVHKRKNAADFFASVMKHFSVAFMIDDVMYNIDRMLSIINEELLLKEDVKIFDENVMQSENEKQRVINTLTATSNVTKIAVPNAW